MLKKKMNFFSLDTDIYLNTKEINMSTTNPTENDKSFTTESEAVASAPVTVSDVDVAMRPVPKNNHTNFYRRKGDMVWRIFYDNSTFKHDGRYRCVAYCRNEADGLTEYGAAVFKKDNNCTFNKRLVRHELSHTARKRFEKRPVRLVMNEVSDRTDLHKRLKKAMFRYGVKAERVDEGAEKLLVHGSV